jgi:capsid protein
MSRKGTPSGQRRLVIRKLVSRTPTFVAAGNSSGYNYASGRLDHQTYFKAIRVEQSHLECVVLDRILHAWLDEAVLIPGLIPSGLPPFTTWESQWFFEGREHVDPSKEASAQATRLANHTATLAEEYARRGLDWEEQLRQRAKEVALMTELGLAPANTIPAEAPSQEEEEDAERAK